MGLMERWPIRLTLGLGLQRWLAPDAETFHAAVMTVNNAASLEPIGTLLLTILLAVDFIRTISSVLGGFVPAMALLRSLVYCLRV
jgi:hypothetical protein